MKARVVALTLAVMVGWGAGMLMSAPGRVFSRTRILNQVWGYSEDPLTNVVDVYIARLRRKIDTPGREPLLETLRGHGYRMESPTAVPGGQG